MSANSTTPNEFTRESLDAAIAEQEALGGLFDQVFGHLTDDSTMSDVFAAIDAVDPKLLQEDQPVEGETPL